MRVDEQLCTVKGVASVSGGVDGVGIGLTDPADEALWAYDWDAAPVICSESRAMSLRMDGCTTGER